MGKLRSETDFDAFPTETASRLAMLAEMGRKSGDYTKFATEYAKGQADALNFRYSTPSRAGYEQTRLGREVMGLTTFPRGMLEMIHYKSLRMIGQGMKHKNYEQAARGLANFVGLVSTASAVQWALNKAVGRTDYGVPGWLNWTPLAPGVAWLFDSIQNMTGRGGAAETVLSMPGQAMHGKVGELGKSVLKLQGNAVVLVGSGITTFMTPVSGTALNVVEGFTGTTGLSPAFLLGQALRQAEGLPSKNVKHTIRTPYEKVVHILMGGFEKGSGKGPDILSQYGLSPEQVKEMVNDARNQVPGKTDYQPVIDAAKQWLKEYEAGKKTRLSTKEIP